MLSSIFKLKSEPRQKAPRTRRNDFKVVCVLGSGGFGVVKLVEPKKPKREDECYAMKVIDKKHLLDVALLDPHIERLLQAERDLSVQMREEWGVHPFIVTLEESFQTPEKLYYLYEYCDGGELFDLVHLLGKVNDPWMFQFFAGEIVEGLSYLHINGVLHRDLKLENVLLAIDGHIKICDFGCAKFFKDNKTADNKTANKTSNPLQSPVEKKTSEETLSVEKKDSLIIVSRKSLFPPEYFSKQEYGVEGDCWQLGLMFYTMICGHPIDLYGQNLKRPIPIEPFKDVVKEANKEPGTSTESPDIPPGYPQDLDVDLMTKNAHRLINGLLHPESRARLGYRAGAEGLKKHAFFEGVPWENVRTRTWRDPPQLNDQDWDKIQGFHNDFGRDSTQMLCTDVLPIENFSYLRPSRMSREFQDGVDARISCSSYATGCDSMVAEAMPLNARISTTKSEGTFSEILPAKEGAFEVEIKTSSSTSKDKEEKDKDDGEHVGVPGSVKDSPASTHVSSQPTSQDKPGTVQADSDTTHVVGNSIAEQPPVDKSFSSGTNASNITALSNRTNPSVGSSSAGNAAINNKLVPRNSAAAVRNTSSGRAVSVGNAPADIKSEFLGSSRFIRAGRSLRLDVSIYATKDIDSDDEENARAIKKRLTDTARTSRVTKSGMGQLLHGSESSDSIMMKLTTGAVNAKINEGSNRHINAMTSVASNGMPTGSKITTRNSENSELDEEILRSRHIHFSAEPEVVDYQLPRGPNAFDRLRGAISGAVRRMSSFRPRKNQVNPSSSKSGTRKNQTHLSGTNSSPPSGTADGSESRGELQGRSSGILKKTSVRASSAPVVRSTLLEGSP